ncbi:MAG: response regulator [Chitinophaga sp.]|uniref:response regulator n=1 Tax=Chitinophaga sp. TaxID=1869181 RepID=UPI001B0C8346|nr:response regulator [Chitinophaga sp.]MBO9728977.1 response regulator [Chitinophaga sp.]
MNIRILHADDDTIFSGIVKRILHQSSFEVYNAYDGEEAWQLFNKQSFHYCLLDIMMPRLNGIDLGERIREVDKQMPIFYLSGEDPSLVEREVFGRGGGNGYFNKTFNIRQLSDILQYYFTSPVTIKTYEIP